MRFALSVPAAVMVSLALASACDKSDPKAGKPEAAAPKETAEVKAGRTTFEQKCVACHTIGQGDRTGPDLRGVTHRRTTKWLESWLRDPVSMGESDHVGKELSSKFGNVLMPN